VACVNEYACVNASVNVCVDACDQISASGRLQGSDIQGVFERNYQRVKELSANYQCGFKTFSGSTERATCRCIDGMANIDIFHFKHIFIQIHPNAISTTRV